MTRRIIFLLAVLSLLSTACVIAVVERSSEGRSWPIQSEYRESLDLTSGAGIILENTDGDIVIAGWDEERLEITATRRRELPSSAGLYFLGKRFSPPRIQTQKTGETVKIRTEEEDRRDGNTVHYVLKVPRSVRLEKISNGEGDILISDLYGNSVVAAQKGRVTIENYSGSLDIQLESGGVEAELLDLRPGDKIRIRIEQGDIIVHLEPGIAGRFSLESPAGGISSEIDLNLPLPAREVISTTGDGGVSVELTALRGDIKIRKVEGLP